MLDARASQTPPAGFVAILNRQELLKKYAAPRPRRHFDASGNGFAALSAAC
jgi:hypothetical protein